MASWNTMRRWPEGLRQSTVTTPLDPKATYSIAEQNRAFIRRLLGDSYRGNLGVRYRTRDTVNGYNSIGPISTRR